MHMQKLRNATLYLEAGGRCASGLLSAMAGSHQCAGGGMPVSIQCSLQGRPQSERHMPH